MTANNPVESFRQRVAGKVIPVVLEPGRPIEDVEETSSA
jgi:hypothetical protein